MTEETKKRISAINSGIIPKGYKKTKVGIVPVEWDILKLADIMHIEQRPVEKPSKSYIRIGIRSHAKGTFQELVENPVEVNMDTLYVVKKDDLIVNITFAWEHAIALAGENDENKLVSHRFPTYVFDDNSPTYYKYVFFQDIFRQRLELISPGGAGRNRVLNKTDFLNLEIYRPSLFEQQKIAEILSTQDKLIELIERKIEQMKTMKKGYLQKMFPKKESNVPELRFNGFTDDWEQFQFSDLFTILQNNTLSRADLSDSGCGYTVHYGDVLIRYGEILDASTEQLPCISSEGILVKFKASFLQDGDIIIADTAEDETVGKCTEICGIQRKSIVSGLHTIPCRPQIKFSSGYLGYYMNSGAYHDQLLPLMQGTKVTSVSKSALQGTSLKVPESTDEQERISSYFSALDRLITLHQRKIDEEKQKKKALMQLLLTGKVRVV